MRRKQCAQMRAEQLDSRITPAVSRSIGTFAITDMVVNPQHTWIAPDTDGNNNVISTDRIDGTLDVTYNLSGKELARARAAGAGYVVDDEIRWRESDTPDLDDDVAKTFVTYNIQLGAPTGT